jgi:hypothetical protein
MIGGWAVEEQYIPLAFDYDNTTLYIAHNAGRDKLAIYKYDTKARKMGELVLEDPLVDVDARPVYPAQLLFSRHAEEAARHPVRGGPAEGEVARSRHGKAAEVARRDLSQDHQPQSRFPRSATSAR